jgi:hypothetical protein
MTDLLVCGIHAPIILHYAVEIAAKWQRLQGRFGEVISILIDEGTFMFAIVS